jgi:hypothetical protein
MKCMNDKCSDWKTGYQKNCSRLILDDVERCADYVGTTIPERATMQDGVHDAMSQGIISELGNCSHPDKPRFEPETITCENEDCDFWDGDIDFYCSAYDSVPICDRSVLVKSCKARIKPKPEADPVNHPDKIKNQRGSALKKAIETINGDRQDSYGNPEDSFALIAEYWSIYQGIKVTARNVAEMMTLFKIARMSGQKPEIDNYVDAAGYIGLAADMLEGI